MPHTRTGKQSPIAMLLVLVPRDFDKIPEAEDEAISWVGKGHMYDADIPRKS